MRPEDVRPDQIVATETGEASWYGARHHGRRTASGEPFDMHALTAAHRTLPFGTLCRVTSRRSGRMVIVRINDRGPWSKGRIIDLSRAAAEALGMIVAGHVPVTVEVLRPPDGG
jgi:rare lipoprotein A